VFDRAWLLTDLEPEGHLRANSRAEIAFGHMLKQYKARLAAGGAQPERSLFPQVLILIRRDERFHGAVRRTVSVQCNRGQRPISEVIVAVLAELAGRHVLGKEGHAVGTTYSRQPNERQPSRIQDAVL